MRFCGFCRAWSSILAQRGMSNVPLKHCMTERNMHTACKNVQVNDASEETYWLGKNVRDSWP